LTSGTLFWRRLIIIIVITIITANISTKGNWTLPWRRLIIIINIMAAIITIIITILLLIITDGGGHCRCCYSISSTPPLPTATMLADRH
jgi:hypothetical protein